MAQIIEDRVKETSISVGTGNFTLSGAVTGFRSFSDVCANLDTVYYTIQGVDGSGSPTSEWEVGLGTWNTGGTLSRTTVLSSSNSNSAVNFSSGDKLVWLDVAAVQLKSFQTLSVQDITAVGFGEVLTLPNASTLFKGQVLRFKNTGNFHIKVEDFGGTALGFINEDSTLEITCLDNSTASGTWDDEYLQPSGVIAEKQTVAEYGSGGVVNTSQIFTIDSNRQLFVFSKEDCYGIIYDKSSGTWGSEVLLNSFGAFNATSKSATLVECGTDKFLMVAASSTSAVAAVLSISGTSITVNAPVSVSETISTSTKGLVRLPATNTYVYLFQSGSNLKAFALSISGTTITTGVPITISAGNAILTAVYANSSSVFTAVHGTSLGNITPASVSGLTITVGTPVTTATTTSGVCVQLASDKILYATTNAAPSKIHLATITGTVATLSSVDVTGIVSVVKDLVVLSPTKVFFVSADSNLVVMGILKDTSGTLSVNLFSQNTTNGTTARIVDVIGNTVQVTSASISALPRLLYTVDVSTDVPSVAFKFLTAGYANPTAQLTVDGSLNPRFIKYKGGVLPVPATSILQPTVALINGFSKLFPKKYSKFEQPANIYFGMADNNRWQVIMSATGALIQLIEVAPS